jgi:hypothetical protein
VNILYFYVFPLLIAFLIFLLNFKKIKELIPKIKELSEPERNEKLEDWLKETKKFGVSITELQSEKKFLLSRISEFLHLLFFLFITPVFCLRMALIAVFGVRITWRMPFSLYEIWSLLFLGISFYYSSTGNIWLSFSVSTMIIVMYINQIADDFRIKSGSVSFSKLPNHKLRIGELLESAAIVSIGFASLYYAISIVLVNSFSEPLTVFSSVYFSIVTVSTVGFGDITPSHWVPRAVVTVQIVLGFIYTVLLVSIFIGVWSSRFTSSVNEDVKLNKPSQQDTNT